MHLSAVILPDRTVLATGGSSMEEMAHGAPDHAQIYRPATGTWTHTVESRVAGCSQSRYKQRMDATSHRMHASVTVRRISGTASGAESVILQRGWRAEHRHEPSPVNWLSVPPYRFTTAVERSSRSVMISRNRSAPTAAAMSIE
jgi:hypothetical protein